MTTDSTLRGQCYCGAVRYRVAAAAKWCGHCHCSQCRRVHGAAFVTWFGVPLAHFEVEADGDALHWFHSSDRARRGFCRQCGSPLFFHGQQWDDEMHISRASLTEGSVMPPQANIHHDSHVTWGKADGLACLAADGSALPT